jgi:arginine repressor
VHTLNATCPPEASVWRFEDLFTALRQHFSHLEGAAVARRALDELKLVKGKASVREYTFSVYMSS